MSCSASADYSDVREFKSKEFGKETEVQTSSKSFKFRLPKYKDGRVLDLVSFHCDGFRNNQKKPEQIEEEEWVK